MNNDKIFNGFDKVKWGSTIDEVKAIYPELIEDNNENILPGIRILAYEDLLNKDDYLESRFFKFYNNKLGLVNVSFYSSENFNVFQEYVYGSIVNTFVQKYGSPKIKKENEIKYNGDGTYDKTLEMRIKVSPEMEIMIFDTYNILESTDEVINHAIVFEYMNINIVKDFNEINQKKYNLIL